MNTQRKFNVLFICTSNSSRSIMAEAMLNSLNHPLFQAFSAAVIPKARSIQTPSRFFRPTM